jgi:hypothetical protein
MTQEDKIEFKDILKDYVGGVMASLTAETNINNLKIESQFTLIKQQLEQIVNTTEETKEGMKETREQTIQTDKRVTQLEIKSIEHNNNCPVIPRIRYIEDKLLAKQAVNKFLIIALGVLSTCLGIIIGTLTISAKAKLALTVYSILITKL